MVMCNFTWYLLHEHSTLPSEMFIAVNNVGTSNLGTYTNFIFEDKTKCILNHEETCIFQGSQICSQM